MDEMDKMNETGAMDGLGATGEMDVMDANA